MRQQLLPFSIVLCHGVIWPSSEFFFSGQAGEEGAHKRRHMYWVAKHAVWLAEHAVPDAK